MAEPLKPIWQVVHREVLIDLLACAATYYQWADPKPERVERAIELLA